MLLGADCPINRGSTDPESDDPHPERPDHRRRPRRGLSDQSTLHRSGIGRSAPGTERASITTPQPGRQIGCPSSPPTPTARGCFHRIRRSRAESLVGGHSWRHGSLIAVLHHPSPRFDLPGGLRRPSCLAARLVRLDSTRRSDRDPADDRPNRRAARRTAAPRRGGRSRRRTVGAHRRTGGGSRLARRPDLGFLPRRHHLPTSNPPCADHGGDRPPTGVRRRSRHLEPPSSPAHQPAASPHRHGGLAAGCPRPHDRTTRPGRTRLPTIARRPGGTSLTPRTPGHRAASHGPRRLVARSTTTREHARGAGDATASPAPAPTSHLPVLRRTVPSRCGVAAVAGGNGV